MYVCNLSYPILSFLSYFIYFPINLSVWYPLSMSSPSPKAPGSMCVSWATRTRHAGAWPPRCAWPRRRWPATLWRQSAWKREKNMGNGCEQKIDIHLFDLKWMLFSWFSIPNLSSTSWGFPKIAVPPNHHLSLFGILGFPWNKPFSLGNLHMGNFVIEPSETIINQPLLTIISYIMGNGKLNI